MRGEYRKIVKDAIELYLALLIFCILEVIIYLPTKLYL
jgi:hypothetical protein